MNEIERMSPGDDLYIAKVNVLRVQIEHHIKEEETKYFPSVRRTSMDLGAVGARLQTRWQELTSQGGRARTKAR